MPQQSVLTNTSGEIVEIPTEPQIVPDKLDFGDLSYNILANDFLSPFLLLVRIILRLMIFCTVAIWRGISESGTRNYILKIPTRNLLFVVQRKGLNSCLICPPYFPLFATTIKLHLIVASSLSWINCLSRSLKWGELPSNRLDPFKYRQLAQC